MQVSQALLAMDLHSAGHRQGVVCAPHHAAVEAGRAVLADGGNAIEAMVSMAATITAVYPHLAHLGGDGFWLLRGPSGRVRALMAAGAAGIGARPERYRDFDAIPPRGPLAALTVPAAVAGWKLALEAARSHGGRLPLAELLAPAIRHANEGYAVTVSQARLTAEKLAELEHVPGFAPTFLIDGEPPEPGRTLTQRALAGTLEQLAHAGLDDFYRGDVGREMAGDLERVGSPLTRADLEGCHAALAEPLSVTLDAGTLFDTPAPTQGLAALMILALFARLRVKQAETFDHVHGLVEATKQAFRVRDRVVTDPARLVHPLERYLDAKYLDAKAHEIDRRRAAPWPSSRRQGEAVWMGAADAGGVVASYVQSLAWGFGSGLVLPRTGVLMQNRGAGFSLDPGELNALAPGRVPLQTLSPALAVLADGRVLAYGASGSDGQPQAALFTRHVLYGAPLEHAIDAPRWLLGSTRDAAQTMLRLESRFEGSLIERLISAGHDVEVLPDAYSDLMGHGGALVLHPSGSLEGAHDRRADGGAAGV